MRGGGIVGKVVVMITVEGLTRSYGAFTAVDDVSFTCRPGRVTGFLGPNGAGKTTTMRIMVGLTNPSRGRVTIGGHLYKDIPNPGRHVGVLLDAGAQHAGRTGREILSIGARTMGLPSSRVDEMLALVSLEDKEASRRLRNYSLGMKQRLGIAHALLGDPSVLILDEPANGLDPAGIRWMRSLLKGYADRGGTVLLSSHLLNEVEMVADEMILIGRGKIVAQGDKKSLLAGSGKAAALVTSLDNTALAAALSAKGLTATPAGEGLKVDADPVDVGRTALEAGVVLTDLRSGAAGLEDLFLELTSDTQREQPAAVPAAAAPQQGVSA
jgi:ABC-2 type transport system ATP-binding protein